MLLKNELAGGTAAPAVRPKARPCPHRAAGRRPGGHARPLGHEGRRPKEVVTLRQALPNGQQDRLNYAKGADTRGDSEAGFGEAIEVGKHADVVLMALGEART